MKSLFYFIPLLICISACKPDPGPAPSFTVKGRVVDGTTGAVPPAQQLEISWVNDSKKSGDLTSSKTDANGNFSFTYTKAGTGFNPVLVISGTTFQLRAPINKNIDSTFYLSSMGNVKINLATNNMMGASDTLFLGYPLFNTEGDVIGTKIDTLIAPINGYYKTIRTLTPSFNTFTGRGWIDFSYNMQTGNFTSSKHRTSIHITGDPVIDNVTVNY